MLKNFMLIIFLISIFTVSNVKSGNSDVIVKLNGYADAYFANDNEKLPNTIEMPFNYTRSLTYVNYKKNQFGLNIAQVCAEVAYDNLRGNITLQAGDLVASAWQTAGALTPIIQQAYAGFNAFDKVWIDAGYFLTHIGGEALLPKDNWLSSHSLVTYYEPFYQAGVRISYEADNFTGQLHILNGNGRIEDNNVNKTFGLFLSYKPFEKLLISYANVIGNEEVGRPEDGTVHMLHNLVATYNINDDFAIRGQFDMASKDVPDVIPQNDPISGSYMGISLTAHYLLSKELNVTGRFALVNNEDGVYAPVLSGNVITLGCEYKPADNYYLRLEGSMFQFDDKYKIFINKDSEADASKMEIMLNFGVILK
jgi:hypothetical protein